MKKEIIIKGARLNNLKNVNLSIPKNKLIVLTGLSGSGKSTLAFDTIHKEGQRQYMESLGRVTDYISKPKIDSISGLSPSISVGQELTNRSPRSTIGTMTEVFTYLRVLYARIGHRHCAKCGHSIPPDFSNLSAAEVNDEPGEDELDNTVQSSEGSLCPNCGAVIPLLTMAHFSFNKLAGACPVCTGLGVVRGVNLEKVMDESKSIANGAVFGWDIYSIKRYSEAMIKASGHFGFQLNLEIPVKEYQEAQKELFLYGTESKEFKKRFPGIEPPETSAKGRFEGIVTNLMRRYAERAEDLKYREKMEKLFTEKICGECGGERLNRQSAQVTVGKKTISELSKMPLSELSDWIRELGGQLSPEENIILEPVLNDLQERLKRLIDVGTGYLSLERPALSISAGEAQRLRLAALLGSGLTGVLYVLDEPTLGLHPRDNQRLINVLQSIRDLGNTVLVIEHDLEIVRAADFIIDMGPGAGKSGGEVVATGSLKEIEQNEDSPTGAYLSGRKKPAFPAKTREGNGESIIIREASEHNLKNLTVSIPLGKFVSVTGVSGSGKSTLMFDILDRAGRKYFYDSSDTPGKHKGIEGWENIDGLITIDQSAIGKSPRSNAATYTDAFTSIRDMYSGFTEAKKKGFSSAHFSFNVEGGRCERCQGAGILTVSMHFLPDVQVKCPECQGKRYKKEVLEIKYNGYSISDILDMTIAEATPVFQGMPSINSRLSLMNKVGLGYLQLGQPATTLSGGEAQRIKLAKELGKRTSGRMLYLLDEPSTGLHPADIEKLLFVLQGLVDSGHTVIVIEHNLDIVRASDWVIDMGPEGGEKGGMIITEGEPESVSKIPASHTGRMLAKNFFIE